MTAPEQPEGRIERKPLLLRLDPSVYAALARWAADDFRSLNAHLEMLLRQALRAAGREPHEAGPLPKRGRPARRSGPETSADGSPNTGEAAGQERS